MPFTAGGRWTPPPYVDNSPPAWWHARNAQQSTNAAVARGEAAWVPSTLSGSRVVTISGQRFTVPRRATVKRSARAGTLWVHLDGQTYVLSELGMLDQSEAERRSTRWELL